MIIQYKNRIMEHKEDASTSFDQITYEVSEEDLIEMSQEIANSNPFEYSVRRHIMAKDKDIYIAVDNIDSGYILIGGRTSEGKYVLTQYIVYLGVDKVLEMLKNI